MRNISIGLSALLLAGLAAADPIPTESGFNGSVGLGVGGNKVKSNLYKGDKNQRTNSLNDSPESHNDTFALPVLSLSYTFAASRTQIVFDSQIHDPLGMDDTLELGVRQEVGNNGIVSAGLLYGGLSKTPGPTPTPWAWTATAPSASPPACCWAGKTSWAPASRPCSPSATSRSTTSAAARAWPA